MVKQIWSEGRKAVVKGRSTEADEGLPSEREGTEKQKGETDMRTGPRTGDIWEVGTPP